jgi:fermentation-respiration switch protein FrsA (DUF1100 family)
MGVPGEDVRAPAQDDGRRGGQVVQQTPQLRLDLLRGAPAGPGGVPAGQFEHVGTLALVEPQHTRKGVQHRFGSLAAALLQARDYCTPRGYHPRANQGWVLRSVDLIAQYDSYAMIRLISPRPLLMIAGSEAESAYFSREAIEEAAEPKELVVIDGATHIDLYDKDAYVTPAVAKLTEFFGKHLAG